MLWKVHRSSSRQLGDERLERGARWEERQGSGGDEDNQGWLLELGDQPGNSDDEEDVDKNIQGWLLELGDQPGNSDDEEDVDKNIQGWLLELGDQPGNSDDEEDVDKNIQGWLLELGDQPGRGILRGEGRLGGEPPLVPFHLPPHQGLRLPRSLV